MKFTAPTVMPTPKMIHEDAMKLKGKILEQLVTLPAADLPTAGISAEMPGVSSGGLKKATP